MPSSSLLIRLRSHIEGPDTLIREIPALPPPSRLPEVVTLDGEAYQLIAQRNNFTEGTYVKCAMQDLDRLPLVED